MGVIKKSSSPWAISIVYDGYANRDLRLAIYYRRVNGVSQPVTLNPNPITVRLDRLQKTKYFSVSDTKAGYHQFASKKKIVKCSLCTHMKAI